MRRVDWFKVTIWTVGLALSIGMWSGAIYFVYHLFTKSR
jgi:hypothetical protein